MTDESGTTVADAATVTEAVVVSKEDIIARAKAAIEAAIADIEAAEGRELTAMRTDLAAIDHTAETVWSEIEAWFKKHF